MKHRRKIVRAFEPNPLPAPIVFGGGILVGYIAITTIAVVWAYRKGGV